VNIRAPIKQLIKILDRLEDPRHQEAGIHKFRVQSRRLEETLRLNRWLKEEKTCRLVLRQMRELRKRLGQVREEDVHIELCRKLAKGQRCLQPVLRQIKKSRDKRFEKFLKKIDLRLFKNALKGIPKIQKKSLIPRRMISSPNISRRIDRIFRYYRDYQRNHRMASIHMIRIEVKKLRYSLEVLQRYFPHRLDVFISRLKELQDELGQLHDLETLGDELSRLEEKMGQSWNEATLKGIKRMNQKVKRNIEAELMRWNRRWPRRQKFFNSLKISLSRFVIQNK
jgi:CHAD domain-containing protein